MTTKYIKKGYIDMKLLKKYISVLAAVALLGSFAAFPAYSLSVGEDSEDVEETESGDEDIEFIPGEEGEDEEEEITPESDDDTELIDIDGNGADEEPEDDPDVTDTPSAQLQDDTTRPAQTTAAPTTTPVVPPYNGESEHTMYAKETVRVRYGPDTSYSQLGTVYATNAVTVIGRSGGWLAIKYNGTTGFVSGEFFTDTAPSNATTTTTAATQPPETQQPAETTEPQTAGVAEVDPAEITTAETEAPETTEKTKKTKNTETEPAETTPAETTSEAAAAAVTEDNTGSGGMSALLIALGAAAGTFVVAGLIPVIVHKIYHKKLYQY